MKILILGPREPIPPIRGGAIEKLTFELAKALKKYHVAEEVVLVATTDNESLMGKEVYIDGVRIIYISTPIRGSMFYLTKMPRISLRMRRFYNKIKSKEGGEWIIHSVYFYNLVSFNEVSEPILVSEFEHYPWLPEYLYHRPFITSFRRIRWELDAKLRINMAQHILDKAVIMHAVSRFQADLLRRHVPKILNKLVIIPNFVNTEVYKPQKVDKLRETLLGDKEILAGFIGRLTPHKNLHLLLMAMARTKGSLLKKLRLVIIGPKAPGFNIQTTTKDYSYEYFRFIQALIEKYGLRDHVVFLDSVKERDLPYYISSLDFLIHPSFVEAFGLVLIEAMACGKPVIVFDVPPLNEIVHRNVGLLSNISIKDLASKIELMIEDDKLRASLAKNAITYVRNVYDVEKVINHFRRIYMHLSA